MSGCSDLVEKLEAHALGFLADAERKDVEDHLGSCRTCSAELDGIRQTLGLLDSLPARLSVRADFRSRIQAIPDAGRARFPWGRAAAAAGWLLAVGLGAFALKTSLRPVPPDPRVAALEGRLEAQGVVIGELRQDLGRQAREREALVARLDRQDELLRSIESQARRDGETIRRGMKTQEEQIRSIGEGVAALVRRNAETKPATPEPPKPEPIVKPEPPPAAPLEAAPARSPVDAAQGFLLSVFRDRGGSLNQKIRAYKEDLNRTYDNR